MSKFSESKTPLKNQESQRYQGVEMVLPDRIELSASPLPRGCSTTELRQHLIGALSEKVVATFRFDSATAIVSGMGRVPGATGAPLP